MRVTLDNDRVTNCLYSAIDSLEQHSEGLLFTVCVRRKRTHYKCSHTDTNFKAEDRIQGSPQLTTRNEKFARICCSCLTQRYFVGPVYVVSTRMDCMLRAYNHRLSGPLHNNMGVMRGITQSLRERRWQQFISRRSAKSFSRSYVLCWDTVRKTALCLFKRTADRGKTRAVCE
jgi:predicted deacetylase